MSVTWEQLVEHTGGEMVGGQLYARLDGVLTHLGSLRGSQFDMTPEGETIARELDAFLTKSAIDDAAAETASSAGERKGGSRKRVAALPEEPVVDLDSLLDL